MKPRIPGLALLSLAPLLTSSILRAAPDPSPDNYPAAEDLTLSVDVANGVLSNDTPGGGTLSAVLESDVAHGTLSLGPDGSFSYTPAPDFNGTDSFTYRAIETPTGGQEFTIVQGSSEAEVDASLTATLPIVGAATASDSETAELKGNLTALVTPSESPFSQIHITDFEVTIAESIDLHLGFFFIFTEVAGVDVNAAADGITIEMAQPGAASAVDGAGNFSQLQNEVRVVGNIDVDGTGGAAGLVPEGSQAFDLTGEFIDLNGTITQSGNVLTLTAPIVFSGVFDLDGNSVDLDLTGNIVATSPVQTAAISAPVTVTINVAPRNDAPTIRNENYTIAANSTLIIPASLPGGGDQPLVDTGAIWKFLDDGSDLGGTAWTAPDFDDAAWLSGPSQLGYGDAEATTVGFGGDDDNKHITTYFRHQFSVPDPEAHGGLSLRLRRDDGAAIFLNGTEIVRSNLPAAASAATAAATSVSAEAETHYYEFTLPTSLLSSGTNTLAAEVHQSGGDSTDLIFDLQLIRHRTAGGVLANDSDPDGDDLTASVHAPPANGDLSLLPDGSFTYTPDSGFAGTDTFIYQVQDVDQLAEHALIPFGDEWKFLDDGSNQGTAWRAPGFDDSSWSSGPGELGYGDPDQATTVGFGPDANNKFATTYFRNHFLIGNVAALTDDVLIRLTRDDAAAIYINGAEIYRDSNLVGGALFNTFANPGVADEDETVSITVPLATLQDGRNSIAVEVHQSGGTSSDLAFNLALIAEMAAHGPLLPAGSVWKYFDAGDDLGTAWTGAAIDDALWLSGPGELGYGDGDETTALPQGTPPRPLTVYFRRSLIIPDASQVQALAIDLLRDDGAAVYINGTEVLRDNLPAAATFDTAATATVSGAGESTFRPFVKIDPSVLHDGENTIAVEVHQAAADSSDISFDLRINSSLVASLGIATIEVIGTPIIDTDNDGIDDNWETANGLSVGIDDSAADPDGDGARNIDEFHAGTDPQNPISLLQITGVVRAANGDLTVNFASIPGKTYRLQHSPDLVTPFTDIDGAKQTAISTESSFTSPQPLDINSGYLRVSVRSAFPN